MGPSLARATECSDEFHGSVLQLTNSTKYERVFPQITQRLSLKDHLCTLNGTDCNTFAFSLKKLDTAVTHGVFNKYIKFKSIQKKYLKMQARSKSFGQTTHSAGTMTTASVNGKIDYLPVNQVHKKKYRFLLNAFIVAACFINLESMMFHSRNEMKINSLRENFTPKNFFENRLNSDREEEKCKIGGFILMNEFAPSTQHTDGLEDFHQIMIETNIDRPREIKKIIKKFLKKTLLNVIPSMSGYGTSRC